MSEKLEDNLDAEAVTQYLNEVGDELAPDGPPLTIVVVGGSLLALLGLRDATRDVDSIRRLNAELLAAREVVANRHDHIRRSVARALLNR